MKCVFVLLLMLFSVLQIARASDYDNSWCFKGVFDYDNCPEKGTLHDCVRCCTDLRYYQNHVSAPSKNVCLAACADKFPDMLKIEWRGGPA